MKRYVIAAFTALALGPGSASAMPCDGIDFDLRIAVQDALMGAEDPQISRLAGYLNESFYTDLTCRLSHQKDDAELKSLTGDPAALITASMDMTTQRNQSDALMLILMAMQATVVEE
ncbi:hypothetical protein [Roseovarius sp. E0-M6]|uniref:hypothetical protein n=1 Tax=Roseovarius sp. E0-M6 TaxID=3127118 RepID=UPI0030102E6C